MEPSQQHPLYLCFPVAMDIVSGNLQGVYILAIATFCTFSLLQVASSIVLCTFMSAPIMYVSARLVLITEASDTQYDNVIQNTRRDVTAVALAGLVRE